MSTKVTYGAQWVAQQLGVTYHTVGVKLRAAHIPKKGKMYDFGSKTAATKVVRMLSSKRKAA